MARTNFYLTVEADASFSIDEIWPDGDAPENPTIEDVIKKFTENGSVSPMRAAIDWGMEFELGVY